MACHVTFTLGSTSERSTSLRRPFIHAIEGHHQNLEIEEPILCWDFPSLDFHPALPGMLSTTLIRHQVVQMREPCEKRLLTATWMVKSFHREPFPLDSVMGLIQQGAG